MSIEIKAGNYYLGIWFFELPVKGSPHGRGGDYMACAWRDEATKKWWVEYRFRYKRDEKVWDSEDDKNWYVVDMGQITEAEVEENMDSITGIVASAAGTLCDFFPLKGGCETSISKLKSAPPEWMHTKTEPIPKSTAQCNSAAGLE